MLDAAEPSEMTTPEVHEARPIAADLRCERLWLTLRGGDWTSLALVPTAPGVTTIEVAEALRSVAQADAARQPRTVNATGADVSRTQAILQEMGAAALAGERLLISTDFPLASASALRLMNNASRVVLVVQVGRSRLKAVRSVADAVSPARLAGSVLIE